MVAGLNGLRKSPLGGVPLTVDALDKFNSTVLEEQPQENVRATEGQDSKGVSLEQNSKRCLPGPVDWNLHRGNLGNRPMPKYICEEWAPQIPHSPGLMVDTSSPEFKFGSSIVENGNLRDPVAQPETVPDIHNSEDGQAGQARLSHKAETESVHAATRLERRVQPPKKQDQVCVVHDVAITPKELKPQPHETAVDFYLRPATQTDLRGIAELYNHYVQETNSIVTEDQALIAEEDIDHLLRRCKSEKLPVIVAVRGRMLLSSRPQLPSRHPQRSKLALPQVEGIIGFGFAESYNYGIGGLRTGRSRVTASLQFYVHPECTRKGIGSDLLDRLIQLMSSSYGARDEYDWMDAKHDPIYRVGGSQYWHQLIIQLAVMPENDPNYEFIKKFLRKYSFDEECRLQHVARSSAGPGGAHFADVVIFMKEASDSAEFEPLLG